MRITRHVRRPWALVAAVSLAAAAIVSVAFGSTATAAPAATGTPASIQYTTSAETFNSTATVNFTAIAGEKPPPTSTGTLPGTPMKKLGRPHPTGNKGTPITAGNHSVVRGNVAGVTGFTGVTGPESAAVNVSNSETPFSDVAPPDQATCTGPDASGNPISFDFVNDAAAAYSTSGSEDWPVTPAWAMFGLQPSAFLSDPRCYYDAPTQRWFFAMFVVGSPAPSTEYVAVSKTSDPLGAYTVFGFDTTDANNPLGDCPCFGDYDQIGADANGFYITTNEFSNITPPAGTPSYNGTVLYAVSKQGLEASATAGGASAPALARYQITSDPYGFSADASGSTPAQGNGPYHLSPASTPPGGTYAPGTEYFVESNSDLFADDHLIVYALSGTSGLNAAGAAPPLTATELTTEAYAFPPNAVQKNGSLPLGSTFGYHEQAPTIETDFNATQETTYSAGQLYTELDTATVTSSDSGRAGIAWFDLAATAPTTSSPQVTASVAAQGYVATSDSLLYPDMVVDGSGNGYLDFSMSGTSDYPSTGYVTVTAGVPSGDIHMSAAGTAPEDDFTCYPPFGSEASGCRWGDYSGGAVWDGRIYMMAEYVPPTPRDPEDNWGTFVWSAPTP